MKFFYRLLITIGIICYIFGIYLIWERNNPNRLVFKNYSGNYKHIALPNPPVRIVIDDLNIDLPLFPAKLTGEVWPTTTQGASFLVTSPLPGQKGNSIIYAHDWASLFGPLVRVKEGDKVQIYFADHSVKSFIIRSTAIVPYTDSSVLNPSSDKRLTLYTCTGFLDSQRLVATAVYKDDSSLAIKE